jgi:hypothetical protein
MSSPYSVINDLYGVGSSRQQPEQKGGLGLFVVLALIGMFLYVSVHPVMRLRSEPPPVFLKGNSRISAHAAENRKLMVKGYWNVATDYASENYSYGQALPSRPPEDFTMAMGGDYATSTLYWHRLRGLWNQPETWVRSYQLDTTWVKPALASLGRVVINYLNT